MRRAPHKNVLARELVEFLDSHATLEVDLDGIQRSYINGVWVNDNAKREIRRYRNLYIHTVRPTTVQRLINHFHLEAAWQARQ